MFKGAFLLKKAWDWRMRLGLIGDLSRQAGRLFHGPGEHAESSLDVSSPWSRLSVDHFQRHLWLTLWPRKQERELLSEHDRESLIEFYRSLGFESITAIHKRAYECRASGSAEQPETWWGKTPSGRFSIEEGGLRIAVNLEAGQQTGLFLDHAPLRAWLLRHSKGLRVLNTFSYTCSLSLAAALGQAQSVTSLDLSRPALEWGQFNFGLNDLEQEAFEWVRGDYFDWLSRWARTQRLFDMVVLDPPSFARRSSPKTSKQKSFSTKQDGEELHRLAFRVLQNSGILISSLNSVNVTLGDFRETLEKAARAEGRQLQVLAPINLPASFPSPLGRPELQYLKGWILKVSS